MKYLVIPTEGAPFRSKWTDIENIEWSFIKMVIDTTNDTYTVNGLVWDEVEIDHL